MGRFQRGFALSSSFQKGTRSARLFSEAGCNYFWHPEGVSISLMCSKPIATWCITLRTWWWHTRLADERQGFPPLSLHEVLNGMSQHGRSCRTDACCPLAPCFHGQVHSRRLQAYPQFLKSQVECDIACCSEKIQTHSCSCFDCTSQDAQSALCIE